MKDFWVTNVYIQVREDVDVMSVCIERLSLEPASSLTARVADISGYFVEFQVLDYDYGDLETPSVPVSPHSTHPVFFNFKKGSHKPHTDSSGL